MGRPAPLNLKEEAISTPPPDFRTPDGSSLSAPELDVLAVVSPSADGVVVPDYLEKTYWWAYVRPWAIRIFERPWLVNLILWGWYKPLMRAAFAMLGENLSGNSLQMACVYGEIGRASCRERVS
jgi:hypothetical protein